MVEAWLMGPSCRDPPGATGDWSVIGENLRRRNDNSLSPRDIRRSRNPGSAAVAPDPSPHGCSSTQQGAGDLVSQPDAAQLDDATLVEGGARVVSGDLGDPRPG